MRPVCRLKTSGVVEVERSPKFDRDAIAMLLAGATIRRDVVVFSRLFEFPVLVDSSEELLEGAAVFFVLSPHAKRWFGFDAVQSTSQHGLGRVTAARDRRCGFTRASRSVSQAMPQARLQSGLGCGKRLHGTGFSPCDATNRHSNIRACEALAAGRRTVGEQKCGIDAGACLATRPGRPRLTGQHDIG